MVLSPWAPATPSGFGVPGSAPSSYSKADAGPSCCRKGKSVWSGWLFSIISQRKKKNEETFFMLLHIKILYCHGPSPTVSCGQSRSALQALGGWGVKQQLLTPPWLLSPRPGACCPAPGRGLEEGEREGAQRAAVRGAECLYDDLPKAAEEKRLWQPTGA